MREINFRAWDGKEMFYISQDNLSDIVLVIDHNGWQLGYANYDWYVYGASSKKNDILMQYTDLKDIEGKEIYEGDFLHAWGGENFNGIFEYNIYGECKFEKGSFYISSNGVCYDFGYIENYEKIGNIYENPELLTK